MCAAVQEFVGSAVFATTVANATLGLLLALVDHTPPRHGRQVLMPSFTFAAVPDAALLAGMQPVFLDVDPRTLEMNIEAARRYLRGHQGDVAATVLCNPFGIGAESMTEWEMFAAENEVALIVDSAAGFGSRYSDGNRIGGRGDCEVFSLHATKPFGVGEGGLIVSRDETMITRLRARQNFGFGPERTVERPGINAKLAELPCAIGLRQLERLNDRIAHRQRIAATFAGLLAGAGVMIPRGVHRSSVPFLPVLAPSPVAADTAFRALRTAGVEAQRYYNPPLHCHPAFASLPQGETLAVTTDVCDRILSLPVHDSFTNDDVEIICATLISSLATTKPRSTDHDH